MTIKITESEMKKYMGNIRTAVIELGIPRNNWSIMINSLGFSSCKFIEDPKIARSGCWTMDDHEYTWFVLRFS